MCEVKRVHCHGINAELCKIWVADYVRYAAKSCNMTLARQQQSLENYMNLLFLLLVNWCF